MTYPQGYPQFSTESPRAEVRTRVPSEPDLRGRERGPAKDPLPRSSALPPAPKGRPGEASAPGEDRTSLRPSSDGSPPIESQTCGSTAYLAAPQGDELGLSPESKSERAGFDSSVARTDGPSPAEASYPFAGLESGASASQPRPALTPLSGAGTGVVDESSDSSHLLARPGSGPPKTICCKCDVVIRDGALPVSHGYCEPCVEIELEKIG